MPCLVLLFLASAARRAGRPGGGLKNLKAVALHGCGRQAAWRWSCGEGRAAGGQGWGQPVGSACAVHGVSLLLSTGREAPAGPAQRDLHMSTALGPHFSADYLFICLVVSLFVCYNGPIETPEDAQMRPAEITNDQIIEAGQALQAEGRRVTGFALRQRAGGGNPARLRQVWDEYAQGRTEAEPAPELPAEVAEGLASAREVLAEQLAELVGRLNGQAVLAAERRVTEAVRAAGEQRELAEREMADAATMLEAVEAELADAKALVGELQEQLAALQAAHQDQAVELGRFQARAEALQSSQDALMAALSRGEVGTPSRRKGGRA